MRKRIISLLYKLLVIISLSTGIILNLINTKSIAALLSYYTLQSNIMCLITFLVLIVLETIGKDYQKKDMYWFVKGAIIISILITSLVYKIALAPNEFQMESLQNSIQNKYLANLLVHEISPILVVLDYFLFDKKGNFKIYYPFLWLFIPLNYVFYVYSYSARGGHFFGIGVSRDYAYIFLDYKQIGYIGVAKWIIMMAVFIMMLSYLLVIIDYFLGKIKRRLVKLPE